MIQQIPQQPSTITQSLSGGSSTPIPATTKNIARDLYLNGDKSQAAIASQLSIHPKTLSYWIKQNKWHEIKSSLSLSPIMIRYNLYMQLEALSDYILNHEDGNAFPSIEEVGMQYKLVSAIFKFPNYTYEDIENTYRELYPLDKSSDTKKFQQLDKDSAKHIGNQPSDLQSMDKDGIKKDKERISPATENDEVQTPNSPTPETKYVLKKNVVLRSGARWIERGIVYDPVHKRNRQLRKSEWDELLSKGLTKADFQGWHPDS